MKPTRNFSLTRLCLFLPILPVESLNQDARRNSPLKQTINARKRFSKQLFALGGGYVFGKQWRQVVESHGRVLAAHHKTGAFAIRLRMLVIFFGHSVMCFDIMREPPVRLRLSISLVRG